MMIVKRSLALQWFLLIAGSALAQDNLNLSSAALSVQGDADSVRNFSCWALGAQARACVSRNGNLRSFASQDGKEHIAHGAIAEGYVLGWTNPVWGEWIHWASDLGYQPSQGWKAATVSQPNGPNTMPLTITRRTSNGELELKQAYARDSVEGELTLTMILRNLSNRTIWQATVCRYVDIDAGGETIPTEAGSKYITPFISTGQSVLTTGMGISSYEPGRGAAAMEVWPNVGRCDPNADEFYAGLVTGQDAVARLRWYLVLKAGQSTTMKIVYRGY